MMQKVLEKIRYYEEEFEKYGEESYCYTIALSGINDTFPEFIEAILINAMKEKKIIEYRPIYFYKAAILEQVDDFYLLEIGNEIDGIFTENNKQDAFYFKAIFKNNICKLETNLYNINCIYFKCPNWLEAMLNSYIVQYNVNYNCVFYLGPKLQEQYIQNKILKEKGADSLNKYKEEKLFNEKLKNVSFLDFENINPKWFGCDSLEETMLILAELYPVEYQKWIIMK